MGSFLNIAKHHLHPITAKFSCSPNFYRSFDAVHHYLLSGLALFIDLSTFNCLIFLVMCPSSLLIIFPYYIQGVLLPLISCAIYRNPDLPLICSSLILFNRSFSMLIHSIFINLQIQTKESYIK